MAGPDLEQLKPIVVASIRHNGRHEFVHTNQTWEQLILWASPRRLLGRRNDVRAVGMLWDDPRQWGSEMRRYDVGIPIQVEDSANVETPAFVNLTMPGQYLKVTHRGGYEHIQETVRRTLEVDMPVHQLELVAAPILEFYRNSPAEVSEGDLVTDLYFPVARL